jgi:ABC-type enterochelin transport system substrate-binding protein
MGTTEVPYAPTRVAVLDAAALDTMDALGLGEYIVQVQSSGRKQATYLQKYFDDDKIPDLTQSEGENHNDAYNAIDADLIIGSSNHAADYEYISSIAPTIIMNAPTNFQQFSSSVLPLTRQEATIIASIWGKEAELEAILADYEARFAALQSALSGKTGVIMTRDERLGGVVLANLEGYLLLDLGLNNLATTAPEDIRPADSSTKESSYSRDESDDTSSDTDTSAESGGYANSSHSDGSSSESTGSGKPQQDEGEAAATLKVITDWIETQNPEYVFIIDSTYTSVDEAEAAGVAYPGIKDLTVYKNGNVFFLSGSWQVSKGGLTSTGNQLAELEKIFL